MTISTETALLSALIARVTAIEDVLIKKELVSSKDELIDFATSVVEKSIKDESDKEKILSNIRSKNK